MKGNYHRVGRKSVKVTHFKGVFPEKILVIKDETIGKYFFTCPNCGSKKRVSVMDMDLLFMGRSKYIRCMHHCTAALYDIYINL